MSVSSIATDTESSTIIDENISIMTSDTSETTVATQTSRSWHSVISNASLNNNLFTQSHSMNIWLKFCSIEPDIRLTTAQEWKLRTCMRRLLSLCSLPIKISCLKIEESLLNLNQKKQLGLYLHTLSTFDTTTHFLEVKLFEFDFDEFETKTLVPISLIKSPKLIFNILLNNLQLNLRTNSSFLQLRFSTRENDPIQGYYYQWNESKIDCQTYKIHVEIDQSLNKDLNRF